MERVFRAIAVTICGWIYPLIPPLYEVFYDLAGARYFTDSTMNDLASNFYINNRFCKDYNCQNCPFQAFCSDEMEDVYYNIEQFLNNEDWR